ncbi:MAG: DivIVA domain-containing protein [Runella slithyformis]|nr:MAG: DivIVA domain-containing protein [Runella slithyformis]TAF29083.1 MAG: DivIVA domain-containing protein [Runella slithyformis]TAF48724.1 MAG: DivIVA domain-containing protein [Runella slithyformis]TAF80259.1 MAG: DivIVA domain-containing protein [Runella slithyformis]TAH14237.1 MAG: DivIVA domain-containing protein [Runella slithyformis]
MKITPIEIRQHTFQRVLRGYDTEEVTAFLTSLSNEWERVLNENKMLKMQLEIAEKELNKLRELELTMFRMLKTAEDTSSQMTEQAKTAAEQYINDARQKGEEIIGEARKRGNILISDSENQAKYVREEVLSEFKNHERDFKAMEKYRDNLIVQLKTLANNTTDSIERFEKKFSQAVLKGKMDDLQGQVNHSVQTDEASQKARLTAQEESNETPADAVVEEIANEAEQDPIVEAVADEETPEIIETTVVIEEKPADEGSFFDQIK